MNDEQNLEEMRAEMQWCIMTKAERKKLAAEIEALRKKLYGD